MHCKIELTEEDVKNLIRAHLESKLNAGLKIEDIKFLVKSKQNYKSEWENAAFKAEYFGDI